MAVSPDLNDSDLIQLTDRGLYCPAGDFYVDPWRPVERAVVTHAHADHARRGMGAYLAAEASREILERRLGEDATVEGVEWGRVLRFAGRDGDVQVSFHPAGHVRGSAQVRVEGSVDGRRRVWVISGDYKRAEDPTCRAFEPVACDVFVTEATFGLPVYRWPPASQVAEEILAWWDANRAAGRASLLLTYSLGKAQRALAELAKLTDRGAWLHGAAHHLTEIYRRQGVTMIPTQPVAGTPKDKEWAGELIVAPPSAYASPWSRRFGELSTGFASGWMRVRGGRRRRGYDRGFVLSDHADWPNLVRTVEETGAERVLVTHGSSATLARYLSEERGVDAVPLETAFRGEAEDEEETAADDGGGNDGGGNDGSEEDGRNDGDGGEGGETPS